MATLGHILIVEDDEDTSLLIAEAFRRAVPVTLHVVADGDDALDYVHGRAEFADRQAHPLPSLILLDLKLRKRWGLQVLEILKADRFTQHIPVIMLTSSEHPDDIQRAVQAGANAYVVKPMSLGGLEAFAKATCEFWLNFHRSPHVRWHEAGSPRRLKADLA